MEVEAHLRYCLWSEDNALEDHVVKFVLGDEVHRVGKVPAVIDSIAGTRNIAATWIVAKCFVNGKDMTGTIARAYHNRYGYRAAEFL